jgi:hypothetical protein
MSAKIITKTEMPPTMVWIKTIINLPVTEQYVKHGSSLLDLLWEYSSQFDLDPVNVYNTKVAGDDLFSKISSVSYPLYNIQKPREWLGYWELYAYTVVPVLYQKAKKRKRQIFRSFHMCGNDSVDALEHIIHKTEAELGISVKWEWLSTLCGGTTNLAAGVDGFTSITCNNMRAWGNKISITLKNCDYIISNNEDCNASIIFSLINLGQDGSASIYLNHINKTSTVVLIYIFAACFSKTRLIHLAADDSIYLCGSGFQEGVPQRLHKLLYEFCPISAGSNISLLTREYIDTDQFQHILSQIIEFNSIVYNWRYDYYEHLLQVYNKLSNSASANQFSANATRILNAAYPDGSKKWAKNINYT